MLEYENMADEAWTRLERAGDEPSHPMRLMVLATAADDGTPQARLMVLRGADRRVGRLWFYTDRRSEKVGEIRGSATVCTVAWDPSDGVQLRVRGAAAVLSAGALVERHWTQASMGLHALFATPDAPGQPLPDPRLEDIRRSTETGREDWARCNFTVIELAVESVEWLQIQQGSQRRARMRADRAWGVEPLAP